LHSADRARRSDANNHCQEAPRPDRWSAITAGLCSCGRHRAKTIARLFQARGTASVGRSAKM